MDLPDLLLDGRFGNLPRDRQQASARLALLIAEAAIVVALAAKDDGRVAVIALCHIGTPAYSRKIYTKNTRQKDNESERSGNKRVSHTERSPVKRFGKRRFNKSVSRKSVSTAATILGGSPWFGRRES
jgi:hypothetical protein